MAAQIHHQWVQTRLVITRDEPLGDYIPSLLTFFWNSSFWTDSSCHSFATMCLYERGFGALLLLFTLICPLTLRITWQLILSFPMNKPVFTDKWGASHNFNYCLPVCIYINVQLAYWTDCPWAIDNLICLKQMTYYFCLTMRSMWRIQKCRSHVTKITHHCATNWLPIVLQIKCHKFYARLIYICNIFVIFVFQM